MTFYCTESIKIVARTSTWMLPMQVVCFEQLLVTFFFTAGWIFQEATKEENAEVKKKKPHKFLLRSASKMLL